MEYTQGAVRPTLFCSLIRAAHIDSVSASIPRLQAVVGLPVGVHPKEVGDRMMAATFHRMDPKHHLL